MAITLRSKREIGLMRDAGAIVAKVLSKLKEIAEPGISTLDLDEVAFGMAKEAGADALFRGVRSPHAKKPFPGAICASVNHEVVHGIPSADCILKDGDILSVDFGVRLNGYCGDSAVTIGIGKVGPERQKLMDVTSHMLEIAVQECRPGVLWSQVAGKMQKHAEKAGYGVVRDFVGHGIGTEMHENPKVPNFVSRELLGDDIMLAEGLVLAIEPMVNVGTHSVRTLPNGWTVVTADKKSSAHFEHTVAMTKSGCDVLTSA
ncbi:MAG: type I methionyl aminopeptidase [Phycisphaerae bacterium]|nr:type I methionyl aminopeptidase [Phycisphaerae bacterium]